ncbi:MAG: hypothetical protein IJV84_03345 [Bacteroidales bacterium]|nr:hypothetical protein [Bacteroidales bacterium]
MKMNRIISALAVIALSASCVQTPEILFGIDTDKIEIGPAGGQKTISVSSSGNWVAMTESPWISVSPANGRGSVECSIQIDSALVAEARTGTVRIHNLDTDEKRDFTVSQQGFDYQILPSKTQVDVEDYAAYESRYFEVRVKANVDFDVILPDGAEKWLSYKKAELNLDRGARPREAKVRFDWKVNSRDVERVADIRFEPKEEVALAKNEGMKIVQKAALPIPENTPAGDSLALLAVSRALNSYVEWDSAEKMEHWSNVKVWKDGPDKGRVRYVQFFMFYTQEEIPFEIQYLTAAEEIVIYSNANHFLRSLDTGEHITKLTNLKRLTIGAYGLTSLHPDFKNLKNLEYLDLSSNCFQTIPDILTEENFPNLHSLIMNANQRHTIYDLSNDIRENVGGLIDEPKFPERILRWNKLDTIRLSVNYLQGELPSMSGHEKWTKEEVQACDTLPDILIGLPKVLPDTDFFAINFNRLTGELPDWLLYHPKLDLWYPYSLVFSQEGKTRDGKNAGFSNEPVSLDYYYHHYKNKKYNPNNVSE